MTNDLNGEAFPKQEALSTYKLQQNIERASDF